MEHVINHVTSLTNPRSLIVAVKKTLDGFAAAINELIDDAELVEEVPEEEAPDAEEAPVEETVEEVPEEEAPEAPVED